MTDKQTLIDLYDHDQRIEVDYPDTATERLPEVVRMLPPPDQGGGFLLYSWLDEHNVERVIAEQVAYFHSAWASL